MPRIATFCFALALLTAVANAQTSVPRVNEVTAVFVEEAPRIDGHLDELVWQDIAPVNQFIQVWPDDGAPETERTEVRIAYDRDYLYFAFSCFDTNPELIRAKNLERGGRNDRDDHVYIALDTYRDGRNAYLFEMNALGTQDDATITDEGLTIDSFSWNAVFRSEAVINDQGWFMEVAIPFRQLRFPDGDDVSFGLMLSRMVNRKNERGMWPRIGLEFGNSFTALAAVSQYGTLNGLKNIRRGRNIEIKPYVIAGAQRTRMDFAVQDTDSDVTTDVGVDVKYGITSNLTLDLSVNTDFAQVEADNVQLNLSRFSLFFPEKREFFLERSGLFEHGNPGSTQTFFSRRIGLDENILAGARLTGQAGPLSIGLLNIETGGGMGDLFGSNSSNNTVARVRANVLPRTTTGAIFTNLQTDSTFNRALGVDAEARFWSNSGVSGWISNVWDTDSTRSDLAGHAAARFRNDTYGASATFTSVGEKYVPVLGFVRRRDMRQYTGQVIYSPLVELAALPFIRRFVTAATYEYIERQDGLKQTTVAELDVRAEFNRRDNVSASVDRRFERLDGGFFIRPDAEIVTGDYSFMNVGVRGETDSSRPVFASAYSSTGSFFGGNRSDIGGNIGWRQSQHLVVEGGVDYSSISLPIANGDFTATTLSLNILGAINRKLFARSLIQYDNFSRDVQANIRIDWIHTPGSDLFLVFNTGYHFTADNEVLFDPNRNLVLRDQLGVVKLTYLVLL